MGDISWHICVDNTWKEVDASIYKYLDALIIAQHKKQEPDDNFPSCRWFEHKGHKVLLSEQFEYMNERVQAYVFFDALADDMEGLYLPQYRLFYSNRQTYSRLWKRQRDLCCAHNLVSHHST
jgi:hypothetical protein